MKLKQLRYLQQIVQNGFNVSVTAKKMFTSQSAVSKQILLLEQECGLQFFERNGKHLVGLTPEGEMMIKIANEILSKVDDFHKTAKRLKTPQLSAQC